MNNYSDRFALTASEVNDDAVMWWATPLPDEAPPDDDRSPVDAEVGHG